MTWKSLDDIEADLSKLYQEVDSMGFSTVRPAVKNAVSLVWNLAQQVEDLTARVAALEGKKDADNRPNLPDTA